MGAITDRNQARRQRMWLKARPRIRLDNGRWYAFAPKGSYEARVLLVPAISFVDKLNAKRGLSRRRHQYQWGQR